MIIEVQNLVKRYNQNKVLNHLNLTVPKGQILGLLGPNGSGKSTLINCILGLLKFDRGQIKIFGQTMTPTNYAMKKRIGLVPQELALFDELTVLDNLNYFCGLYIQNKKRRQFLVQQAMELVELQDFAKYYPKQLSGGLKRRLNIACGIAHQPELLFLDEPTVAVDPQSRNKILDSIQQLNHQGTTIIYTTHYMEEVEQLCQQIVILDHGDVIAQGTTEQLTQLIQTTGTLTLDIAQISSSQLVELEQMPGMQQVLYSLSQLTIVNQNLNQNLIVILEYLQQQHILYTNLRIQTANLNDVFLAITGRQLRDAKE
ncbi:ABC transporter ATP-binding protein [Bombilactobacillus folatiphilus]|uniref:ABC transporter ATP-binding protein n=1 Tax=Bombilactobacillus folatiphilus TaxID=2923362 RepID=A0ABY4PAS7_9LACO|nr:ABC transporter ATP-binding protein [Bombilactobacillus folatiphilus]UQS82659.1 ABC transporter ATP-binding protein [Bombilactobacillus folatiphilus]